jgi:hypothetical protein
MALRIIWAAKCDIVFPRKPCTVALSHVNVMTPRDRAKMEMQ